MLWCPFSRKSHHPRTLRRGTPNASFEHGLQRRWGPQGTDRCHNLGWLGLLGCSTTWEGARSFLRGKRLNWQCHWDNSSVHRTSMVAHAVPMPTWVPFGSFICFHPFVISLILWHKWILKYACHVDQVIIFIFCCHLGSWNLSPLLTLFCFGHRWNLIYENAYHRGQVTALLIN